MEKKTAVTGAIIVTLTFAALGALAFTKPVNLKSTNAATSKTITIDGTHNVVPASNYGSKQTVNLFNDNNEPVGTYAYKFQGCSSYNFGGNSLISGTMEEGATCAQEFQFHVFGLQKIEWRLSQDVPCRYQFVDFAGVIDMTPEDMYTAPANGSMSIWYMSVGDTYAQYFSFYFPAKAAFSIYSIKLTYSYSDCKNSINRPFGL